MAIEFTFKNDKFEYTITVYDEEVTEYEETEEETEEEEEGVYDCDVCLRTFKTLAGMKQHKTVMGHNDEG